MRLCCVAALCVLLICDCCKQRVQEIPCSRTLLVSGLALHPCNDKIFQNQTEAVEVMHTVVLADCTLQV